MQGKALIEEVVMPNGRWCVARIEDLMDCEKEIPQLATESKLLSLCNYIQEKFFFLDCWELSRMILHN